MKIRKYTGMVSAIFLVGLVYSAEAQTTNLTQQILQMQTFREGLVLTGDQEPTPAENKELLEVLQHLNEVWWTAGVEQFFKDHPASPWAASLHFDYASYCRRTGRTTKALEQFEAAWLLASKDGSASGQRLGGTILANWTDLLSSLGRLEELKKLVAAGDQWHFTNPHDRDKFQGAKNSYFLMREHPEMAYRCGTFALKAVGSLIQPGNPALEKLVEVPSPTNGFSMTKLVDLAKQYGLNLVAVRRTGGQDLMVPSVVHWRQNHYAAILRKQDDSYLVSDPTFGTEKWLPAQIINDEASGEFLIPAVLQTNGWTQLARNETETIHGMGLPNNINDGKDKGCPPGGPCPPCTGMPIWWVSEPYINVWLADEPMSYLTSRGEPFTFRTSYKQRDSRPAPNDYLVGDTGWNHSWFSYVRMNSVTPCYQFGGCWPFLPSSTMTVFLPNGGEVDFAPGQNYDPETRLLLQPQTPHFALEGGPDNGNNGLRLVHADGAQDIYGYGVGGPNIYGDDAEAYYLLTRHIDPHGNTTSFYPGITNGVYYVVSYVVDSDGRTNTLHYTGGVQPPLLSEVDNPYGLSAKFKYDGNRNLTNIVDAQGLSSSITYDTNGYPTALTTPYGTSQFFTYVNSTVTSTNDAEGNNGGDNLIDRAVLATDPVGAQYLHLYQYDCSAFMATTYSSSDIPTNTPLGTLDGGSGGTNFLKGVCYRNSFYWGPRQYPLLSTTNMFSFTATDYLRGRMQHWLEDTNQLDLTSYLSVEQDASPDGSTAGLQTYYDYQGKLPGYNFCAGTNPLPSVKAWRLPSGETHLDYKIYDYFGNVTNDITTYTLPTGGVGTRTNQFIYAGNTYTNIYGGWQSGVYIYVVTNTFTVPNLLTQVIGADGNPIWTYGGFDTVTWTNLFVIPGSATNALLLVLARVLPDYATNGVGQVATTTFTGYDKISSVTSVAGLTTTNIYNANGFLAQTIDLQIGRTNSFGYTTNGLVGAFTNELGLNVTATWDNLLRRTGTTFPDGTSISNIYYRLDLVASKDRLTNWTYYSFDGARHLVATTNANNAVTLYNWCGCGALISILDALTNLTSLTYDNQGNMTNIAYPDYSSLNYQYDLDRRPIVLSDGAGRTLRQAYNNQGLVTAVSNTFGLVRGVTYDIRDRQAIVTDVNSVTITNAFDPLDRVVSRTWPDGVGEGYGYSPQGLAFYTNRDQKVTLYGRDGAGRLTAVTNANTEVVQAVYNPANEVISLINGLNHTNIWQYNTYGWLTNKLDGLNRNAFRYAYNPNGWLTNRWTPEKGNTGYSRDNVGNVLSVLYPQQTNTYAYNALNWMTNMADAVGTDAFSYTPVGQLQSETGPWPSGTVAFAYSQGLRTNLNLSQPSGNWSQSYGFDLGWRMTNTISSAGAFEYSFGFQPASSLVTGIQLPNDAKIVNTFDALARQTGTALNNYWGHTLDGYSYTPDALGLRTNIVRNLGLTSSTVAAGFDNIGQLTSWSATETNGMLRQNEQLGFGFDAADNLHSRNNGALSQIFNTDAANELTNVTRSGTFTVNGAMPAPMNNVTVNGGVAQTYGDFTFARTNLTLTNGANAFTIIAQNNYGIRATNGLNLNLAASVILSSDNNGNLTNDGARSFGYDSENQLTNVMVSGQWQSSFIYDGLNRRRIARDYIWQTNTWVLTNEVHFIYDGRLLIQERGTNNNPLATYTRGVDFGGSLRHAGGIGGLLARTDTNGSTFYHADGIGNITALINGNENIVARYLYGPFGELIGQWGPMSSANIMQFSSMPQYRGLAMYPRRVYDPNLQRWLNQDPIGERGGINLYRAVGNSPIDEIDYFGLQEMENNLSGENSFNPNSSAGSQAVGRALQLGDNIGAFDDPAQERLADNLQKLHDFLFPPPPPTPNQATWDAKYGPNAWPPYKPSPYGNLIPQRPPNSITPIKCPVAYGQPPNISANSIPTTASPPPPSLSPNQNPFTAASTPPGGPPNVNENSVPTSATL
jgi:RHS repeat-associated protein